MQEVPSTCAVRRTHGAVRTRIQAVKGQPETLPGTHQRGGRHGIDAWRVLCRRGGDGL